MYDKLSLREPYKVRKKNCLEIYLESILSFQGEITNFSEVAQNDARSLKKIGYKFPNLCGGGGGQTEVWKFPNIFLFSYFVPLP